MLRAAEMDDVKSIGSSIIMQDSWNKPPIEGSSLKDKKAFLTPPYNQPHNSDQNNYA